jgi:hypothetical protein
MTERALIECHAEPVFFAPDHPAWPSRLIGIHGQPEFVGNAEQKRNIKGSAGLRQISNCATESTAVEFDRRAFEDPTSNRLAIFIHLRRLFLGDHEGNSLSDGY